MNGSVKVWTILYEASGCGADDEGYLFYRDKPSVEDEWQEQVHVWHVPEGFTTLYALYKRTARCCGSGRYFIQVSPDHQSLLHRAVELNLGVTQPEGLSMTDDEWQRYTESGQWPHPYGVMPLEEDVPDLPRTDAEYLALPVLVLDAFTDELEPGELGLTEDIFTEQFIAS